MNKGTTVFLVLISVLLGTWTRFMCQDVLGTNRIYSWGIGLGIAILCFIICLRAFLLGKRSWYRFNRLMEKTSIEVLLGSVLGLLSGVVIGLMLGSPFFMIQGTSEYLGLVPFLVCGFLGLNIGRKRACEFMRLFPHTSRSTNTTVTNSSEKVLDTSAIIDGRIYDVALSGFLEGRLAVPSFVIEELRHIADSSDYIRRSKGRRGLEILSKMQKHPNIKIRIIEGDYPEEREVDMKLLRLCRDLGAGIVTNDYNLNKVAELQSIKVLNVNELTNAVKVIVFPGETMRVNVIKEGKEDGQGVGYLEDGTMVVVESGEEDIGQEVEVVVTSVFQTAAGRMIFTRKTREGNRISQSMQKLQEVNLFG
ncbi:MAG: PIN/TRAM domain-containing protein [Candidatus Saccharibacteria bacterium]